ncbi:MAG TPA: hypothetical protein VGE45_01020 [Chloroflexia bacterium]|jgi:hypothetical protein
MFKLFLESEEHGREEFEYATPEETCEALDRLYAQATEHFAKDGIVRTIGIVIDFGPGEGDLNV